MELLLQTTLVALTQLVAQWAPTHLLFTTCLWSLLWKKWTMSLVSKHTLVGALSQLLNRFRQPCVLLGLHASQASQLPCCQQLCTDWSYTNRHALQAQQLLLSPRSTWKQSQQLPTLPLVRPCPPRSLTKPTTSPASCPLSSLRMLASLPTMALPPSSPQRLCWPLLSALV